MLLHCLDPGCYRDASGRPLDARALASIAAAQENDPVTLVLPLRHCFVTELAVQEHERKYLAESLPWRCEEQLLFGVETRHFGWFDLGKDMLGVVTVERHWLQSVLADLAQAGLVPQAAIVALELVPWQEQEWTLWHEPGTAECPEHLLLRHGRCRGLVCGSTNLGMVLQVLADEQAALPQGIRFCIDDKDRAATLQALMPPAMQGLLRIEPQRPCALPASTCNMLQGEFQPPLPWQRWWRQWRIAALLLLALLFADLALTSAEVWRLHRYNASIQLSMHSTAAELLPGAELVDPLLQLRRAVAASGGANHSGLLAMLTRMAPVLPAVADVRIQSLDYNHDSGELQLVIESSGFAAVESLRAGLQAQGLRAELLGSTSDGSRSRSRLRVRV